MTGECDDCSGIGDMGANGGCQPLSCRARSCEAQWRATVPASHNQFRIRPPVPTPSRKLPVPSSPRPHRYRSSNSRAEQPGCQVRVAAPSAARVSLRSRRFRLVQEQDWSADEIGDIRGLGSIIDFERRTNLLDNPLMHDATLSESVWLQVDHGSRRST